MTHPTWYLEGLDGPGGKTLRVPIAPFPFTIGRTLGRDLMLNSQRVSQLHAEFFSRDGTLWLRDCESTNGTFVNGLRLYNEQPVAVGDIVHFADVEFRVEERLADTDKFNYDQTLTITRNDKHSGKFREFRDMLSHGNVQAMFQPIVSLPDAALLSYELLGRGQLDGVSANPGVLFAMADTLRLSSDLSRLFRAKGMEESVRLPDAIPIFLNSHPAEMQDPDTLLASLRTLRESFPQKTIVLEVHESAITDVATLKNLTHHLKEFNIDIAFDDFGVGQSRLLELTEAAPRFLKFDASLIQNLHQVSSKRQDMVKTLVNLALDMDILTIAEGIEKTEEAEICQAYGFHYAQGFFYGTPEPVTAFL